MVQLGYKNMDDWYKVTQNDIYKNRGTRLLDHYYSGSPYAALLSIYPEHHWIPWKFQTMPKGHWENRENQQAFFDWLWKQSKADSKKIESLE